MKKTMIKQLIGLVCIGLAFSASATTWTYKKTGAGTSTAGTITNEQWTITVKSFDEENGVLALGNNNKCAISARVDPEDTTQVGILDLRDMQVVKGDDTENPIEIKSLALSQSAFSTSSFGLKELYCNKISSMGSSCFASNTDLIKIVIGGPAEEFPGLLINRCTKLVTAEFNFPNVKKAGNGSNTILGINLDAFKSRLDISTFGPGITNILAKAFADWRFSGDLTLTNIMFIGNEAFLGASLTNVYLTGSLANLQDQAFRGTTITNVVLDLPDLTSIHYQAFGHSTSANNQQQKIRRVEFVSAIADMGLVTNIVQYANNSNIGDLRIYVSKKQWDSSKETKYDKDSNPTGFFADKSTITDAEKESIDADTQKNVIGVLVKAGMRKGIFVHKASIHDKATGFAISVR